MIYEGLRIKTPTETYIKRYKTYEGEDIWSFFYNYGKKNKETDKYEILERYTIFIKNIIPNADSEVICNKIVSVKPVINTSKDGRQFMQCEVTIEAENVANPKLSRYQDHAVNPPYKKRKTDDTNNNVNANSTRQSAQQEVELDEDSLPF